MQDLASFNVALPTTFPWIKLRYVLFLFTLQLQYSLRRTSTINAKMLPNANCSIVDEHSAVPVLHTRKHSTPLKKSTQAVANNVDGALLQCRKMECTLYKCIQDLEFTRYELHFNGFVASKLAKKLFSFHCIKDITVSPTIDKERFDDDWSCKNSDDLSTKEILELHINSQ